MTLDELHAEWEKDTQINPTELDSESLKITRLHAKYYRMLTKEKQNLALLHKKYKELHHEKLEFLINPTQEKAKERGWEIVSRSFRTNKEYDQYLEGDQDLLKLELAIGMQNEKTDMLVAIIQSLRDRGYLIKNALEDRKLKSGN